MKKTTLNVCMTPMVVAMIAGLACAGASEAAPTTPTAGMLRWPDVSRDRICFVYANDIWVVGRDGGVATPLASPPGLESFPKFSPDGKTIAFAGDYDGNRDLYTMPVEGGVPFRVTHHPSGENLAGWTPDGKLLFMMNGLAGLTRQTQLFTVDAGGGMPEQLPVPYAGFGAISPDGTWLAYTLHSTDTRTWKRYRGGMATDVWLFNLKDRSAKKITDWEGTDTLPMWVPGGDGSHVYYLSDNGPEHRLNIWSYSVGDGTRAQVTAFKDDDIRWPSMGPGVDGKGEIVFQLGDKLMLLSLSSGRSTEVKVTIPGDRPRLRTRGVDASKYIASAAISPTAKRVVIEARGDLWSAPAKEGVVRNLTRTSGIAERDPSWSPDGRWIAYFSDETGENELWVRESDARPPEVREDKKEEKKDGEKAQDEKPKPPAHVGARKLTNLGAGYRFNPTWSPDSTRIAFADQAGRLYISVLETGETKEFDKDPWMNQPTVSWSGDSRWIAYARADEGNSQGVVWIGNVLTGEKHAVTSAMFNSAAPTFDRKGDFLFFRSQRAFTSPVYADIDTTFAYTGTDTLLMTPLRKDVKNPWLPKSDEEQIKESKKEEKKEAGKDKPKKENGAKDEEKKDGAKKGEEKPADEKKDKGAEMAVVDDGVTGAWSGTAKHDRAPEGAPAEVPFSMRLKLADGAVTGSFTSVMGSGKLSGTYDKASGGITISATMGKSEVTITGTVKGEEAGGTWSAGEATGTWSAHRVSKVYEEKGDEKEASAKGDEDKPKEVKIDFDGFEARAMPLPVSSGDFGQLAVADGEKLVYVRRGARGENEPPAIKVFEYTADEREEKTVTGGAGAFQLAADGKKMLVFRGGANLTIVDPGAGGGKSQKVPTDGMDMAIDARAEWREIFTDAWRVMRDYFYQADMHGVSWDRMREHYGAMVEDAATREDVNWIISEMISELNIGHAYLGNPGDVEHPAGVGVGMLGCDFELVTGAGGARAYRIARIYHGAPWDSDARGPLSQPGVDVKEGDFLLAVDGVPMDTTKDPWAGFIGTDGRIISLTVCEKPVADGSERQVLVKPASSEANLRYRAWIEHNRAKVEKMSGGKVGYIYVPNTGVDGQSDLFRQFFGQRDKAALLVDERWNGGGQIPTRFIELLNRPVTNYWARRDGKDWTWPPDSHQGPKAMLINGLAGSGGDMFPWLFKHDKIGKVFGMRTWGGLVGISGNPAFVDGGSITVPDFGFYETDGTWGVEGHGVDPDVVVVDDPSKMQNDGDPQLDAGVSYLLEQVRDHPYTPPKRPASPDRSGMGIKDADK